MTSAEEQLRLYAGAITERLPLPPLDRSRTPAERHHRGAFALAAAVLVLLVLMGAVLAIRHDGPAPSVTTTTTTDEGVTTELSLSTDAPAPDEAVTATLVITNESEVPVTLRATCAGYVVLSPGTSPPRATDPAAEMVDQVARMDLQYGAFAVDPPEPISLDGLQQSVANVSIGEPRCPDAGHTVAPGTSEVIAATLAVGALGMAPGPGTVSTTFYGEGQPANVSIPFTIPDPPEGVITRSEAVATALADPRVRQLIAEMPRTGTTPPDPPSTIVVDGSPVAASSMLRTTFSSAAFGDGWQVGYAQSTGEGFLVTVTGGGVRVETAGAE